MGNRPLQGIFWMLLSGLCFVAVNGTVRATGSDVPATQAAFLRFAFGVLFLLPLVPGLLRMRFSGRLWRLFVLRGIVHCGAVIGWFFAMARIPVAEVTALNYLNPILVTLGSALLFGERLSWRRVLAVAVAVVGTLIVLRPGVRAIEAGHLSQIIAACLFAASYLIASRLSKEVPATIVVVMMSVTVTIGLAPLAFANWVPVTGLQLVYLALAAAFGTGAHYCMTRAFDCAPLTVTQPVTFLQLVWGVLLGWIAFGEPVDPFVLLGGGLIISAIAWLMWRDSRQART